MIIWRGWGIVVIPLLMIGIGIVSGVSYLLTGDGNTMSEHNYLVTIAFIIAVSFAGL